MLSKKTRYAILALASLAREFGNGPVPISRIAGDEHIPQRFLEGILLELKNGGVLGSVRGKAGGYYLSRDPGEVTLCDVVTRFEGTAGMLACASGRPGCSCEFSKEEPVQNTRLVCRHPSENDRNAERSDAPRSGLIRTGRLSFVAARKRARRRSSLPRFGTRTGLYDSLKVRVAGPKASGQRVRTSENRAEAWAEGFRRRIAYFAELLLTLDGPNDSA